MFVLTVAAWPLLVLSVLGLAYWLMVAYRVHRTMRDRPTVRAGLDLVAPEAGWPAVSVVVPVHNEETDIDACVRSLREQQYDRLELVFVLDRCTDGTAGILDRHAREDDRIVLIENESCPEDWAGKCHAAQLGAERAQGDWLLFTDADTVFDPELVRATVALALDRGLGLLSLLSTLTYDRSHERLAQPVASMNLIRMYPIERVNRPTGARPFANGQFMLFNRSEYERIGGHAAVKDDLLEDIAFARRLGEQGGRGGVFLADGLLRCAMYDSLGSFRLGWKRIYIEACKRKPRRLRKNAVRVLANGVVLPVIQALALTVAAALLFGADRPLGAAMLLVVLAGWLVQAATLAWIYGLSGAPRRAVILYPIGCWVVGRIMLAGASDLENRRPIPWGGRQYVLEPRR